MFSAVQKKSRWNTCGIHKGKIKKKGFFASRALAAGISADAGAQLLHQSTPGLFRRYAHLAPDAALRMVNLLGKKYDGEEL